MLVIVMLWVPSVNIIVFLSRTTGYTRLYASDTKILLSLYLIVAVSVSRYVILGAPVVTSEEILKFVASTPLYVSWLLLNSYYVFLP